MSCPYKSQSRQKERSRSETGSPPPSGRKSSKSHSALKPAKIEKHNNENVSQSQSQECVPTQKPVAKSLNIKLPADCCLRVEPVADNLPVIELRNADFINGTYRIKMPACYRLMENISFNPRPTDNKSRPELCWFAAISVECRVAVIDLNQKTLEASQDFIDSHSESIFALIELDNCPFPGDDDGFGYGQMGTAYPDSPKYKAAGSVLIHNGTLKRSSHWGIHGNNNSNVTIRNLNISGCEVAAIAMNALEGGTLEDLDISGCQRPIRVRAITTALTRLRAHLEELVLLDDVNSDEETDPNTQSETPSEPASKHKKENKHSAQLRTTASEYLKHLNEFVRARPDIFRKSVEMPESTTYGIILTNGQGTNLALPIPMTTEMAELGQFVSSGRSLHCIYLSRIRIHDIKGAPSETVAIGSYLPGPPPYGSVINTAAAGMFGVLRWEDAFNDDGMYSPNPFLKAQAFVALQRYLDAKTTGGVDISFGPENTPEILTSILTNDGPKFQKNAKPVFGRNMTMVENKGVFGIRIDCCNHVILNGCHVETVENMGYPKRNPHLVEGGYPIEEEGPYYGTSAWGYEFSVVDDVRLIRCTAHNINSAHGNAFGIDMLNDDSNGVMVECVTTNIKGDQDQSAPLLPFKNTNDREQSESVSRKLRHHDEKSRETQLFDDPTGDGMQNPHQMEEEIPYMQGYPSEVCGVRVRRNKGPIQIHKHRCENIQSPRFAVAYALQGTKDVSVKGSIASKIYATSPRLSKSLLPKRTFGVISDNGTKNIFSRMTITQVEILYENGNRGTYSIAGGFGLFGDHHSIVKESTASYNNGGQGRSVAVLLDRSVGTVVTHNILAWTGPIGFGIYDKSAASQSFIEGNLLFGNNEQDISVRPMPLVRKLEVPAPSEYTIFKKKVNVVMTPSKDHSFERLLVDTQYDRWLVKCKAEGDPISDGEDAEESQADGWEGRLPVDDPRRHQSRTHKKSNGTRRKVEEKSEVSEEQKKHRKNKKKHSKDKKESQPSVEVTDSKSGTKEGETIQVDVTEEFKEHRKHHDKKDGKLLDDVSIEEIDSVFTKPLPHNATKKSLNIATVSNSITSDTARSDSKSFSHSEDKEKTTPRIQIKTNETSLSDILDISELKTKTPSKAPSRRPIDGPPQKPNSNMKPVLSRK